MHDRRKIVPSRNVNVGAGGYVLNNLAEIDQTGRINNSAGNSVIDAG